LAGGRHDCGAGAVGRSGWSTTGCTLRKGSTPHQTGSSRAAPSARATCLNLPGSKTERTPDRAHADARNQQSLRVVSKRPPATHRGSLPGALPFGVPDTNPRGLIGSGAVGPTDARSPQTIPGTTSSRKRLLVDFSNHRLILDFLDVTGRTAKLFGGGPDGAPHHVHGALARHTPY